MYLGYCRVSTSEQAQDNATSLAEQERKCRAIAQLRGAGGYDFVRYVDPGCSGATPLALRPAGGRLLAEAGSGDCVIATKLDRLFRSARDALVTLEDLQKKAVDVIVIDMGNEPVCSNPYSRLLMQMLASIAEFERNMIAMRMEDGREGKRRRGGHLGGAAPFGFRVVGSGRDSRLVAEEAEQVQIEMIREVWGRFTPYAAEKECARLGLKSRAGTPFQIGQLRRIAERTVLASAEGE